LALEVTVASIVSFTGTTVLLLIYSLFDLRKRCVPNPVVIAGGAIGIAIVTLTGHLSSQVLLHLSAITFMLSVGYILFRVGALGGADVKAAVSIAILSPGIEFGHWSNPIFEGIMASGLLLGIVLLCAYLFAKSGKRREDSRTIPLLPIMLVAYLGLQVLALI
jgi:Flp pilus assembly protein protease CpaA